MSQESSRLTARTQSNTLRRVLVATLIGLAFYLRIARAGYGLPYIYYWDEPQLASTALQMLKSGDLNPHFFNYGSLMINLYYLVDVPNFLYLCGQPGTARSYIAGLSDITTNADTTWYWTISHPSFYYWNRVVNVLFGTGTIVLTYFLAARALGDKWFALLAAAFLATMEIHVTYSALVTTDVPVGFFVVGVVLFSLMFLETGSFRAMVTACCFVGLAVATKYNSALALVVPVLAAALRASTHRSEVSWRWLLALIGAPAITFAVAMPYAFLDIKDFLNGVGAEIRHYKVNGHPGAEMKAGLENMRFQVRNFWQNIGVLNSIVAILGLGTLAIRPKLSFILVFPLIFFFFMTGMKVDFHRNFIQVYPFIGLFFSAGCMAVFLTLERLLPPTAHPNAARYTATAIVVALLVLPAYHVWKESRSELHHVDSRTAVIAAINAAPDVDKVIIAQDLRIHDEDLRRLTKPYKVEVASALGGCDAPGQRSVLVLPTGVSSVGETSDDKQLETSYRAAMAGIGPGDVVGNVGGMPLSVDGPSNAPGITVARIHPCPPAA